MFSINDIKKRHAGIDFEEELDIKTELIERHPNLIDVSLANVKGNVAYEKGLYLLTYQLTYQLTLPSSRSMLPVSLEDSYLVTEAFIEASEVTAKQEMVDDELVLVIEGDSIDLKESVIDNILLNIPLRVLTPEEADSDDLPSGEHWTVLTQDQYQAQQEEKKKETNPFAALSGLFDHDSDEK